MAERDDLPTAVLTGRFAEAVRWASHLHADQARKGTRIAYVSPLLAVSSLVLEDGGTEEEAIAGVLHDALEDTPLTVADLERPRTSYMLSKIYGEALCRYSGLPFTIVRPHNVYGPRMGMAHVVPELLDRAHHLMTQDGR